MSKSVKIWRGHKQETIFNENLGLGHLILEVLKLTPDSVTQVCADNDSEMTCHEMRLRSLKIASHLMKCGYKQGDIVGIMAANSENLAPVVFACLLLGLPINTLAPVMIESDIIQMYSQTKPKLIFCDSIVAQVMNNALTKINLDAKIFTLRERVEGYQFVDELIDFEFNLKEFVPPELDDISNSTAIILCSSGTTGSSKGVMKSHKQIIRHHINIWNDNIDEIEVIFNFSTLFWATGFIFLFAATLSGVKRVITSEAFSSKKFIEIVGKYKVTTVFFPPSSMSDFANSDDRKVLNSLKIVMLGGSCVSKVLCEAIGELLPNAAICPVYGTSETDFISATFNGTSRIGSVGRLFKNVQVKIVNEDGESLGSNEQGEICVKSQVTFLGYFNEPEKTRECFDDDGWVCTGDLGYFDDDEFLYIVGRKKDMLKFNNYQVYPSELEELIDSIEGVEYSCVVGVLDEKTGNDQIFAFVKKIATHEEILTADEILNFVNSKVIDAKKLRGGVHFVASIPMTPSGKMRKVEMRKIAEKIVK